MTATSAAASEPRDITAREIGVRLEPVAAAPAIVGGSLRNLTPLFCLPGKGAPSLGQPDHDGCNDPGCCCAHRLSPGAMLLDRRGPVILEHG
jgi:hypothetical protein